MSAGLQILYDEEPANRRPKQRWLPIAVGGAVLAVLALGSFESPIPSATELTTPPPLAIATMPDLGGRSLIGAGNRLSEAGLDRSLLYKARWIADPHTAAGIVTGQSPAPGTAVFNEEDIEVVLSSGGPVISWQEVPDAMQQLLEGVHIGSDEPVLVVETPAGLAYKTDDLLFGECRAVDLTRDTLYDMAYSETCPPAPITAVGGWLGDGAMYAISGLPSQDYLDVASAISIGPNEPLGRQLWSISPSRLAPTVVVDGRVVKVTGGFYRFVLKIPADASLTPAQVADSITPIDIRGDLVVSLSPPLAFYDKPGLAGSATDGGHAARRLRQEPGEPFSATPTVNVVSTADQLQLFISQPYTDSVSVLAVPSTEWSISSTDQWQFAFPTGWTASYITPDGRPGLVVSTTRLALSDERCESYPVEALRTIGARDAWVSVTETSMRPAPEWPIYFTKSDLGKPDQGSDCLEGIRATVYRDSRTYSGHRFDIVVAFGADASAVTRSEALAILASFEPAPRYAAP